MTTTVTCAMRGSRRRWFSQATTARQPLPPSRPGERVLHDTASHWQALMTRDVGAALVRDGFAVLPQAFPRHFTRAVRDEMRFLLATDQMYANATHILLHDERTPTLLEKRGILETELVLPAVRRQVPALEWFFDSQQVFQAMKRVVPDWLGLSDHMIKLQYNAGDGACFPLHFDSYGDDNKCVTAVLYLNDDWRDGDGGEIVLYPFPQRRDPVIVKPRDGDLVLFSSQHMLHRVLPSSKPRFCLTTWIYSAPAATNAQQQQVGAARAVQYSYDPSSSSDHQHLSYELQVVAKILRSPFRRHLAKLVYGDEWLRSLHESHRATPAFAQYMATHEKEIGLIDAATTQMLAKFRAKDKTQPSALPSDSDELVAFMKQHEPCRTLLQKLPIAWF